MRKRHNTPAETREFLTELFDLATDAQKEEISWAIASGNFPIGYVDHNPGITINWQVER